MTDYFDLSKLLSEEQFAAADAIDGAIEVFACAGSGKTRVLTYRIVNMVRNYGIKPSNILALTFTNKAANEMKKRVQNYLGVEADDILLSTIHSFCCNLIRQEINNKPDNCLYTANFQIKDEEESRDIFIKLFKNDRDFIEKYFYYILSKIYDDTTLIDEVKKRTELYFSDEKNLSPEDKQLKKSLSKEFTKNINEIYKGIMQKRQKKNALIPIDNIDLKGLDNFDKKYFPSYIVDKFEKHLEKHNLMDFCLILKVAVDFLKNNKILREKLHEKYKYILIDEYQDVDYIQELLLYYLSGKADNKEDINVFVVGDDDQSIYGWRGVEFGNLQRFEKEYNAKKFYLNLNYRSTNKIIERADSLIRNNTFREDKDLKAKRVSFDDVIFKNYYNLDEEKRDIVYTINNFLNKGYSYNDIAILTRTEFRAKILLAYLTTASIPYRVKGIFDPKKRKEVKLLRKYFKLLINRDDFYSLFDIISLFEGIGEQTINKLQEFAEQRPRHLDAFLDDSYLNVLSPSQREKLAPNIEFLKESIEKYDENPIEFLNFLIMETISIENSFLKPLFQTYINKDKKENKEYEEVYEYIHYAVKELYNYALEKNDVVEAINVYELNSQEMEDTNKDAVSVFTIHASKGLEFKNVIVIGAEYLSFEKCLQTDMASFIKKSKEIEEERRVLYVALTRAEDNLIITSVKNINFGSEIKCIKPSMFVAEIFKDKEYIVEKCNIKEESKAEEYSPKMKSFLNNRLNQVKQEKKEYYKIGDRVKHPIFGEGTIIDIDYKFKIPNSYKIIFDKNQSEEKEISVKFLKLEKV